ncbi:MAG: hypothetical protein ACXVIY_05915 [Mucilaginibacter sp.]
MKKLLLISLLTFGLSLTAFADDTAHLDSLIAAGNTVLPTGHNYNISSPGLHLLHNLTVPAGDTITYTSSTNKAINMATAGKKFICLGLLRGTSATNNPSGNIGVYITADNDTVTLSNITRFTAYGILISSCEHHEILSNIVTNIGYIPIFYQTTGANFNGGKIHYNVVDNSMQAPSAPTEGAIMCQSVDTAHRVIGEIVEYNTIRMPINPTNLAAECCEMRKCDFSSFNYNTCIGGSIGISLGYCRWFSIMVNFCQGQSAEGIEIGDSMRTFAYTNRVNNQLALGIRVDGHTGAGSYFNNLFGNVITGCKNYAIEIDPFVNYTEITGGQISTGTSAINIYQSTGVRLNNITFTSTSTGHHCILLTQTAGDVSMLGGQVSGFSNVFMITSPSATVTDNVYMSNVTLQSTGLGYTTFFSGGGSVGTHIKVN